MTPTPKSLRVVIKIGSSSLTSRHGEISRRKMEKLTNEIVYLKDLGHEVVLVSREPLRLGTEDLAVLNDLLHCQKNRPLRQFGQGLLMESYSELFLSHGYVAAQILITKSDFLEEDRYKNVRNTLNVLLERGMVPIVNENDTVKNSID